MTTPPATATGVTIAATTAADVAAVHTLQLAAFPAPGGGALALDQITEELARPWARSWVAREDGVVVGYLLAWHVVDELHLLNVAVAADRRRRGIGRLLLAELLAYVRATRAVHVLLEVRASNVAAVTLYRAHGFAVRSIRRRYYGDGEDALEMALDLDPQTGAVIPREDDLS